MSFEVLPITLFVDIFIFSGDVHGNELLGLVFRETEVEKVLGHSLDLGGRLVVSREFLVNTLDFLLS